MVEIFVLTSQVLYKIVISLERENYDFFRIAESNLVVWI